MTVKTIPEVDLSLLETDRDSVVNDLKHATIEYGFFYIKNYEQYLDQNVITALMQQASGFFALPEAEKNEIEMVKSRHFLGYNGLEKENTSGKIDWREQIDLCSTDALPEKVTSIYENVAGPNQYPSEEKLPYFKKSVNDFFYYMNEFSILITKVLFEALEIKDEEADNYIDFENPQKQFAKMKLVHYPSRESLKKIGKNSTDQGCGAHKDSGFLTFLFQPTLTENSLQVQDVYGNWLEAPPRPNTIVVNVGRTLEYLTSGVCISSIHQVVAPKNGSRISIPYFQNVKLDSILKPFTLPKRLFEERDARDKLRTQEVGFQFNPEAGEPIARTIFFNRVKAHRDVAERWYPEILKQIDTKTKIIQEAEKNKKPQLRETMKQYSRIRKVFKAIGTVLTLNIRNHTADIKLTKLLPQIRRLAGFKVELKEVLQVAYIWPEFVGLKLDGDDEFAIDVERKTMSLSLKNLTTDDDRFDELLEKWHTESQGKTSEIPQLSKKSLPSNIITSTKRNYTEIIQKQKVKRVRTQEDGLSLLQRIKKREAEKLKNTISPEQKYRLYLDNKVGQVLDIVSLLRPDKPHSLTALTEQVSNSLNTRGSLAEKEARDLVIHLSTKFPTVFKIVEGQNISVLRWKDFDVNELKAQLH